MRAAVSNLKYIFITLSFIEPWEFIAENNRHCNHQHNVTGYNRSTR